MDFLMTSEMKILDEKNSETCFKHEILKFYFSMCKNYKIEIVMPIVIVV